MLASYLVECVQIPATVQVKSDTCTCAYNLFSISPEQVTYLHEDVINQVD